MLGIDAAFTAHLKLLESEMTTLKLLAAKQLIGEMKKVTRVEGLSEVEFRIFSQFGDDGIIQYLIHATGISGECETFIEFGVQDFKESNTRLLLLNNNWRGLILDASESWMADVKKEDLYWRHDLTAVRAFVDVTNVNSLFATNGFAGEIGLLSIDIDGNDYWVWKAVNTVRPVVVIVEYNSLFGSGRAVSIPYDPTFDRTKAHYSNLYWGCSIGALKRLADDKGYALVGSNSAGNNAYFVRRDRLGTLQELSARDAHVVSKFRDSRDQSGKLAFLPRVTGLRAIADLELVDVATGKHIKVRNLEQGQSDDS
jgi:hypothetical protein